MTRKSLDIKVMVILYHQKLIMSYKKGFKVVLDF